MLKNQIKYAIRIFLKDGVYSTLNILGLTLGITVGIILALYLQNELGYDQHHVKKDQIYRMTHHLKAGVVDFNTARTARELAPFLKAEIPEVLNFVRILQHGKELIVVDATENKKFYEEFIIEADTSLLSIFSHDVFEGDRASCLVGPGKVVLTKSIAKKYFGENSAIGKIMTFEAGNKREVSAVISDLPDNSHLKYEIILSEISKRDWVEESTDKMRKSEAMWNSGIYTYLLMPKNYNTSDFDAKFELVFEKYFRPFADKISGTAVPLLQPLSSIHFESELSDDETNGSMQFVYTFAFIGFFIILLACINYMNLATARSVNRAREISIRKVLGNTRTSLFLSILLEAMLLALFALLLSILTTYILLEYSPFNTWIDKALSLNFIDNPQLIFISIGITLLIGILSGIYPAIYIPSTPIVSTLKGSLNNQKSGVVLRKTLIVVQFVISIFVVSATVMMGGQIEFLRNANIGFEKDNLILIDVQDDTMETKMETIRGELLQNPNIESVATSWGVPGLGVGGQVFLVEREGEMIQQDLNTVYSGNDYVKTMGFEIIEGRDFRTTSEADIERSFIINEAAVKLLGWSGSPINKKIRFFHGKEDGHVVGVVKNFNFESLHNKVEPLLIMRSRSQGGTLNIRISGNDIPGTLAFLASKFEAFDPNHPFAYQFLDQEFDKQYRADQIQFQLISSLSFICIFISILGLIGLAAFTAGQKTKEICIRKSLGASVQNILIFFSKGYVYLILASIIIATPLGAIIVFEWQKDFAYQLAYDWYFYVLPGVAVMIFGLLTVIIQSYRSAIINPIEGLRNE